MAQVKKFESCSLPNCPVCFTAMTAVKHDKRNDGFFRKCPNCGFVEGQKHESCQ